jgi:hypothetical protein
VAEAVEQLDSAVHELGDNPPNWEVLQLSAQAVRRVTPPLPMQSPATCGASSMMRLTASPTKPANGSRAYRSQFCGWIPP